jgi:hypothetical protein
VGQQVTVCVEKAHVSSDVRRLELQEDEAVAAGNSANASVTVDELDRAVPAVAGEDAYPSELVDVVPRARLVFITPRKTGRNRTLLASKLEPRAAALGLGRRCPEDRRALVRLNLHHSIPLRQIGKRVRPRGRTTCLGLPCHDLSLL